MIQGFTGQLDMWLGAQRVRADVIERARRDVRARATARTRSIVFVDAWTSLGGSQFLNSTGTGRYMDYLCDEIVPFVDARYPTAARPDHRGIAGKSSGGYGAMVVPMLRPDVFGALASHAGDALFECCYLPEFPARRAALRDHFEGSYEVFFERLRRAEPFDFGRYGEPLELYAYAAAYSPDPDRPGKVLLPFEIGTGRLVDDVWERWLAARPGADGARPRRCAADACGGSTSTPAARTRPTWTSAPRPFARELDQARHPAHARAVRRPPRRNLVPLSRRDPGAGARASMTDDELRIRAGPGALGASSSARARLAPRELVELSLAPDRGARPDG